MLLDTSTLLRTLQPFHPQCKIVDAATRTMAARGHTLYIVSQNPFELWAVATPGHSDAPVAAICMALDRSHAVRSAAARTEAQR